MLTITGNGSNARRGKRILEVALWFRKRIDFGLRKLVKVHVLLLMNCVT